MNKADKLREWQIKRDKLNKLIEEQFNIIVLEKYTLEEKKIAYTKHNELIEEYMQLVEEIKKIK